MAGRRAVAGRVAVDRAGLGIWTTKKPQAVRRNGGCRWGWLRGVRLRRFRGGGASFGARWPGGWDRQMRGCRPLGLVVLAGGEISETGQGGPKRAAGRAAPPRPQGWVRQAGQGRRTVSGPGVEGRPLALAPPAGQAAGRAGWRPEGSGPRGGQSRRGRAGRGGLRSRGHRPAPPPGCRTAHPPQVIADKDKAGARIAPKPGPHVRHLRPLNVPPLCPGCLPVWAAPRLGFRLRFPPPDTPTLAALNTPVTAAPWRVA